MILEVCSNLNDFMILWYCHTYQDYFHQKFKTQHNICFLEGNLLYPRQSLIEGETVNNEKFVMAFFVFCGFFLQEVT